RLNIQVKRSDGSGSTGCIGSAFARPMNLGSANFVGRSDISAADVNYVGDTNIVYVATVTIEHGDANKREACQATTEFSHPADRSRPTNTGEVVYVANGSGASLGVENPTSCNEINGTPVTDYQNIDVDLDFGSAENGSVFICRGSIGNTSGTDIVARGQWTACDVVQFPNQTGPTEVLGVTGQYLRLRFNGLAMDKRHDFEWLVVDSAGNVSAKKVFVDSGGTSYPNLAPLRIFIDARRPTISLTHSDDIGSPNDGVKQRNYQNFPVAKSAAWAVPSGRLQCNSGSVTVTGQPTDFFDHNIEPCFCFGTGSPGYPGSILQGGACSADCEARTIPMTNNNDVNLVTITPRDSCGIGTSQTVSWSSEVPSSFQRPPNVSPYPLSKFRRDPAPTGFPSKYRIDVLRPANVAGPVGNPNHVVAECDCHNTPLVDGDLTCMSQSDIGVDASGVEGCYSRSGAGAFDFEGRVRHICGPQTTSRGEYSIYARYEIEGIKGDKCTHVDCATGFVCCKSAAPGDCPLGYKVCHDPADYNPGCTTPITGSSQDATSNCNADTHFGVFTCDGSGTFTPDDPNLAPFTTSCPN
ncbi:MAG: hypothetical protein KDD25_04790, partial [Bdellovibrionales bacterium]|nr:hypothetical protein [Bdellovibrionales bacterium]